MDVFFYSFVFLYYVCCGYSFDVAYGVVDVIVNFLIVVLVLVINVVAIVK